MTEDHAQKFKVCSRRFCRGVGLGLALLSGSLGTGSFGPWLTPAAYAQGAAAQSKGIEGSWQGTLHAGKDLRAVLKVTRSATGGLSANFYSIDQGGEAIAVSSVSFEGGMLKYAIKGIGLTYEGTMSPDGTTIAGSSNQGGAALPLNFERVTPANAWEIPTPPPPVKPMPKEANPSFQIATIKPSKPDVPGISFRVEGRRVTTLNTTLVNLITFAYGVHPKQIVGAPAWATTDKYDLTATPDIEGTPNDRQLKGMLLKLLAERFQLKLRNETRELSAYALTLGKTGPKLEKSEGDPDGLPGLGFGKLGDLLVHNATMLDFTELMQQVVLDRPVVNRTGLKGRWDFTLKWTPDETQSGGMGAKIPPPTDAAEAPPPLFTAIQEQMGMRLDAAKTAVPVLVVDHVEKPSGN